jgi:hypothetical protein
MNQHEQERPPQKKECDCRGQANHHITNDRTYALIDHTLHGSSGGDAKVQFEHCCFGDLAQTENEAAIGRKKRRQLYAQIGPKRTTPAESVALENDVATARHAELR